MIEAHIEQIEFQNGTSVALKSNSICVIVGPNNAGKSASLADIKGMLSADNFQPIVIKSIQLRRLTTLEEIRGEYAEYRDASGAYNTPGYGFYEGSLNTWWSIDTHVVGTFLIRRLVSELTTRARLADCDPCPSIDARNSFLPDHPFQHMYYDIDLEAKVSAAFRLAFKQDLVIHRNAGNQIPAYVGKRPVLNADEQPLSRAYLDRLQKLDHLESQGDGVRSFASVVGRVLTENRPIQLIDEPEAFLHPPQARIAAEVIASGGGGRQTFIATHSSDILQGLLGNHSARVSVVRLTRHSGGGRAAYLPNAEVAALWSDPILRFSNILDGLFHDGVIVTEADADCRFYEAVASAAIPPADRPDLHFTYSGGKDRLPTVVGALTGLKVPVATIVDFDVLNNDQPLRRIVEAHGGQWSAIQADWTLVKEAVEAKETFLGGDSFRKEMKTLLSGFGGGVAVPKEVLREARKLVRRASPWDSIKSSGLAGIAPGAATQAANRLLATLGRVGVFVAPGGEMEGFCRSIGGHGPRWVADVMTRDLATDTDLRAAREFIGQVYAYLNSK